MIRLFTPTPTKFLIGALAATGVIGSQFVEESQKRNSAFVQGLEYSNARRVIDLYNELKTPESRLTESEIKSFAQALGMNSEELLQYVETRQVVYDSSAKRSLFESLGISLPKDFPSFYNEQSKISGAYHSSLQGNVVDYERLSNIPKILTWCEENRDWIGTNSDKEAVQNNISVLTEYGFDIFNNTISLKEQLLEKCQNLKTEPERVDFITELLRATSSLRNLQEGGTLAAKHITQMKRRIHAPIVEKSTPNNL